MSGGQGKYGRILNSYFPVLAAMDGLRTLCATFVKAAELLGTSGTEHNRESKKMIRYITMTDAFDIVKRDIQAVQAVGSKVSGVDTRLLELLEDLAEDLRSRIPLPVIAVSRRSSLRYHFEYEGMTFPIHT